MQTHNLGKFLSQNTSSTYLPSFVYVPLFDNSEIFPFPKCISGIKGFMEFYTVAKTKSFCSNYLSFFKNLDKS